MSPVSMLDGFSSCRLTDHSVPVHSIFSSVLRQVDTRQMEIEGTITGQGAVKVAFVRNKMNSISIGQLIIDVFVLS
jgi:hypothetical protein